jgi:shikimate kinase
MKLFLIGFMGCGKSYLGKILAQKLGFQFVDVDSIIEHTEGERVGAIFEKQGEAQFRKIESERLRGLQKWDEVVVATGGGAACFNDNMAWMNDNGITVYLKTNPHLLLERLLPEVEKRPLLRGKSEQELLNFINTKVAERDTFYTQATIIVEQNEDGEAIIFAILERIFLLRQKGMERLN